MITSCRSAFALALVVSYAVVMSGCSPLYVLRSAYEEARILWSRQAIEELLQQPDLASETRTKLTLVLEVRVFARNALGLDVGGTFSSFARVDAGQVVHVVLAAHRDRLELLTRWFPIVGRVPYQGFFDRAKALAHAAALEAKGFDTIVQPSVAFSTLGWFDDPLLSNLLRLDHETLASVILHELTHSTRYISGQTGFNESFANFVGYRGAVAFFDARHEPERAARARQLWRDALLFSEFLGKFAVRLHTAYAASIDEEARQRIFRVAQSEFLNLPFQTKLHAGFGHTALNNARVLYDLLYNDRLALFEAELRHQGGNLGATIAAVLDVAEGVPDAYTALEQHLGAPGDTSNSAAAFVTHRHHQGV